MCILFSLLAAGCILIFSLRIHEEIKGAREYADICRIAMTAGEEKDSPDETALKEINPEYAAWLYIPAQRSTIRWYFRRIIRPI